MTGIRKKDKMCHLEEVPRQDPAKLQPSWNRGMCSALVDTAVHMVVLMRSTQLAGQVSTVLLQEPCKVTLRVKSH